MDKARLRAVAHHGASGWVKSAPVPSLGLKLTNAQLRIACSLRLGAQICQPHTCSCGEWVHSDGIHGLSCKSSAGRIPRHTNVNFLLKKAFSSANYSANLEPVGLSRDDGKRPDGWTTFPYKRGKSLVWDFTCNDTLASSYIADTSRSAGAAAEAGERLKFAKYLDLQQEFYFVPVAIETLGPLGKHGLKLIQELGAKIANITGEKRSTSFLLQSISMAIQRGNAKSILGTVRNQIKLDEVFYLWPIISFMTQLLTWATVCKAIFCFVNLLSDCQSNF